MLLFMILSGIDGIGEWVSYLIYISGGLGMVALGLGIDIIITGAYKIFRKPSCSFRYAFIIKMVLVPFLCH